MKKAMALMVVGLVLVCGSTAQASNSTINGQISGIELCPQYICNVAIFAGAFHGQVGFNPNATGIVTTALNHTPLPTEINDFATIQYGGVWQLQTLTRSFNGIVTGGKITLVAPNLFHVTATLVFSGGTLNFDGFLDHGTLIPTWGGSLSGN